MVYCGRNDNTYGEEVWILMLKMQQLLLWNGSQLVRKIIPIRAHMEAADKDTNDEFHVKLQDVVNNRNQHNMLSGRI